MALKGAILACDGMTQRSWSTILSGLAIGAFNPAFAALLAANKKAAQQAATQSAAAATSAPGANLAQSAASTAAAAASAAGTAAPSSAGTVPPSQASAAARDTGASTAVQDFLNYANESPGQKLIDSILSSMGLTEDDLKNMSPDQLTKAE